MAAATVLVAVGVAAGEGPVASTPPDIVVIGDSLTAANKSLISSRVAAGGVSSVDYEALSGRRINAAVTYGDGIRRSSGVEVVRRLRGGGVDPALWVIELGTNDIGSVRNCECADPVVFAGTLIDTIVAAIGPGEPIAWVTVLDRNNIGVSGSFNEALRRRAAVDPLFILIDWYGLGAGHPEWFLDHVHHNLAGVDAFAGLYLDSFRRLLDHPLGTPRPGRPAAERVEHNGFGRDEVAR